MWNKGSSSDAIDCHSASPPPPPPSCPASPVWPPGDTRQSSVLGCCAQEVTGLHGPVRPVLANCHDVRWNGVALGATGRKTASLLAVIGFVWLGLLVVSYGRDSVCVCVCVCVCIVVFYGWDCIYPLWFCMAGTLGVGGGGGGRGGCMARTVCVCMYVCVCVYIYIYIYIDCGFVWRRLCVCCFV